MMEILDLEMTTVLDMMCLEISLNTIGVFVYCWFMLNKMLQMFFHNRRKLQILTQGLWRLNVSRLKKTEHSRTNWYEYLCLF